jgi:hypothetical protein
MMAICLYAWGSNGAFGGGGGVGGNGAFGGGGGFGGNSAFGGDGGFGGFGGGKKSMQKQTKIEKKTSLYLIIVECDYNFIYLFSL